MKHIRQSAALLTALVLVLSLFACGQQAPASSGEGTDPSSSDTASPAPSDAKDPLEEYKVDYDSYFDKDGHWIGIKASDYITLPEDYASIKIPKADVTPTKQDIDDAVQNILGSFTETKEVKDRAIADGDRVNIDFVGSVDGVEFEGGNTNGSGTTVTAGSDEYIDDFLTQIIGHKPGETFDVNVTFPTSYGNKALSGKDAVFKVTVNYIEDQEVPELTDEFVKENLAEDYEVETVSELTDKIRENMLETNKNNYIFNYLLERSIFADKLPEQMIEFQKADMLYVYAGYASMYGVSMEEFITSSFGISSMDELFNDTAMASLNTYAKQYLMYQAIVDDAGLVVDDETMATFMKEATGSEDYSEYVEDYGMNWLRWSCLNYQAYRYLQDNAVVK